MELRPFVLEQEIAGDESFSLMLRDFDAETASLFREAGVHPGGYGWEGVAQYVLEELVPSDVADRIELECEADVFRARSDEEAPLRILGKELVDLKSSAECLREVLEVAPSDLVASMHG